MLAVNGLSRIVKRRASNGSNQLPPAANYLLSQ